ncbi:glycosyltransferase family 2 protein [Pseudomonas fluorescens]|uniref:glycosyltransferase family 2 protein n=1 Tax=Pseudomonas fluorescens TaxID=294 RepID=UPI001A9D2957|nr:glycosyltransferase family A protein [Pseudomonas fluorescens]QTD31472.1 glycosyltransferase family 2 protein [Pseudomonas fluorescens]
MPLISVILPAYNGEHFLQESITSLLTQTFTDFELIIVNDASTDATEERVLSFDDPRIRYLSHSRNQGVATATCTGLASATGKYLALLDQDDIALPQRFEQQVRLLNGQPRLTVAGGQMSCFGASDATASAPLVDAEIKANLLSGTSNLYNPTVMIRHDFLLRHNLRWNSAQGIIFDWDLFVEAMFAGARFANLPIPLIRYRVHEQQQSKDQNTLRETRAAIRLKIMTAFFPHLTADERVQLEPLLQWIAPPPLSRAQVLTGLELIARARAHQRSTCGESRDVVNNFLLACEQRWRNAMAQ